jgi:hypothetical protein
MVGAGSEFSVHTVEQPGRRDREVEGGLALLCSLK